RPAQDRPAGRSCLAAAPVQDGHGLLELGLDRRHEALLDLGYADLVEKLGEEPADDEATCVHLGNAAGLQVEQLLVVEATGRARVASALDLSGLDLEVGHRVSPRAVAQHEVAVELIRVGSARAS